MRKIGTGKLADQGDGGRRLSSQAMKKRLRERLAANTQQVLQGGIVSIFRKQGYYEELPPPGSGRASWFNRRWPTAS